MKKVLILLGLMMVLSTASLAQEPENYVVIEQATNVRSAPNRGWVSYIVRAVVSDIELPVIGRNFEGNPACTGIYDLDKNLWLQVEVEKIEGWVKFCENDFVGEIMAIPETEPLNPEHRLCANASRQLDELGEVPIQSYVVAQTNTYRINVREFPNIGADRTEWLTSEDVYVVGRSSDNTWVKVTYDAMVVTCNYRNYWERQQFTGWVAGFLLDLPDGWQEIVPVVES